MSVVTPVQPSAAQTAAIRQAGAEQNVSAGVTTEITQNPTEATSVYESLQQGQAQPAGTPGTYTPVSTPTQRYYNNTSPSLSRFNQANEGGFTFRTTTPVNTTPGSLSRFNQANQPTTTTESFYEVSLPGGRVASINQQPILFPTLAAAQAYSNAIASGSNPFQVPKQGPPRPFNVQQQPSFLDTIEGPLFSKSAIENTPLIGTLVKGGESVVNLLGTRAQQVSQGYQIAGSNIQGADQPGFARFLQGEAYVGAGFFNLFAYSLGKPNTGLQQTGPAIVGEAIGVGTSAYLLSLVPLPGVAAAGRIGGVALRFGYGSLFGGASSAVQGGNVFQGALFGGATFAIAPEAIGLLGRASPFVTRGVEDIISPFSQAVRGRPFTFATFRLGTGPDIYAPQFEEADVLAARGARDVTAPKITGQTETFDLQRSSLVTPENTSIDLSRAKLQTEYSNEPTFDLNLAKQVDITTPKSTATDFTQASLSRPDVEKEFSLSEASLAAPKFKPLQTPLTQGELDLLSETQFKLDLNENPYIRSISGRTPSDEFSDFTPRRYGSNAGGAGSKTVLQFKTATKTNDITFRNDLENIAGPKASGSLLNPFSKAAGIQATQINASLQRQMLIPRQKGRARQDEFGVTIFAYPQGVGPRQSQNPALNLDLGVNQFSNLGLNNLSLLESGQIQLQRQAQVQDVLQLQKTQQAQSQIFKQDLNEGIRFRNPEESFGSLGFPSPFIITRKQKGKKKGRRGRKSYREFGNILNLRQFEY